MRGRSAEGIGRGRSAGRSGMRCWVAVDWIGEFLPLVDGGGRLRREGPISEVWLGHGFAVAVIDAGKILAWGRQSRRRWTNGRARVAVHVVEEIHHLAVV